MSQQRLKKLLGDEGLASWRSLSPAEIEQTTRRLIKQARQVTIAVRDGAGQSWETIMWPLEQAHDQLYIFSHRVQHLQSVLNQPRWRKALERCGLWETAYWTWWYQQPLLYQKLQALRKQRELTANQKRVLDLKLRDFRRAGIELSPAQRRRLLKLWLELSSLSHRFANRLLDATDQIKIEVSKPEELSGLPPAIIAQARQRAKKMGRAGWLFSIQRAEASVIMRLADSRALRQRLQRAAMIRASELGPAKYDTTPIIRDILQRRFAVAKILGYRSYADYQMAEKMVTKPKTAIKFLTAMARRAAPAAQRDRHKLDQMAARLGIGRLEMWDGDFVADKLRQKKFGMNIDALRQYFPFEGVLEMLWKHLEQVFGLYVVRRHYRGYHPTVRFYEVYDRNRRQRGTIIFDPFSRPEKDGGAWVHGLNARRLINGQVRTPIVACVCNFLPPHNGKIPGLTMDDVHTLFHEFGHVLHKILSDINESGISGISGVEHDAVELPSQWHERFAWEPGLLRHLPRPIPRQVLKQLQRSQQIFKGLFVNRQVQFGLVDLLLHQRQVRSPLAVWLAVVRKYGVMPESPRNRFLNGFSHIFDGGYAAGYYGYMWAEVMAADAFEPLRNKPKNWRRYGAEFRKEILAVGGARPAAVSFKAYRGRKPKIKALLRSYGIN